MSSNLENAVCQRTEPVPPAANPAGSHPASSPRSSGRTCEHTPTCPVASAVDHDAARTVCRHPEQGWVLLCNGVVVFDDTGELLPDGRCVAPHRASSRLAA